MTNRQIEMNELVKLPKEKLQKMFEVANDEYNKINDVEYGCEKSESWEIAVKKRNRLEIALEKVVYSQYSHSTTTGSHELGVLPRLIQYHENG